MDWRLVARQGVDVAHRRPNTMCCWGPLSRPLSGAPTLRKDRLLVPIKLQAIPPSLEHLFSRLAYVPSSASLSQSTHSLVWISDLISMASTCSQPIAHSYPHASIVESGFQFSKPPPSSDASTVRLCRSLQSVCDGRAGVDEWPSLSGATSCRPVTPTCLRGRALGGRRNL